MAMLPSCLPLFLYLEIAAVFIPSSLSTFSLMAAVPDGAGRDFLFLLLHGFFFPLRRSSP